MQTFYARCIMMMSGRRWFFIVITSARTRAGAEWNGNMGADNGAEQLAWILMGASLACGVLMQRAVYFSNLQNLNMPITAGVRLPLRLLH